MKVSLSCLQHFASPILSILHVPPRLPHYLFINSTRPDKYPFHLTKATERKKINRREEKKRPNDNNENDYLSLSLPLYCCTRWDIKNLNPVHWIIIFIPLCDPSFSLSSDVKTINFVGINNGKSPLNRFLSLHVEKADTFDTESETRPDQFRSLKSNEEI